MLKRLLVVATAMTLATFAVAQDAPYGPAQGVKTLSLSGGFTSTTGDGPDVKVTRLDLAGSYFLTNVLEARLGINYLNVDAGNEATSTSILLGGRYYFNQNMELTMDRPWTPFFGAFLTFSDATGVKDSTGFGLEVGAHYFLQPNVAITPTISWFDNDDTTTVGLGFGLTVFFR